MTTHEKERIVDFFQDKGRNKALIIYSCTSGYPVPFEDIAFLEITSIKEKLGTRVKEIGFSGHHLGIAVGVDAYILGS
ncbi:sialic acid synthase SpsE [Aquibacillus albus]|uniref:Sialic acid synthase SpsE n=2 Tax=Aquibacillus albus TaxID=1168171 RepID=A0ABS2N4W2_9BACI|nr:sialic acid synthase SpsE [Aquibacillus albus]